MTTRDGVVPRDPQLAAAAHVARGDDTKQDRRYGYPYLRRRFSPLRRVYPRRQDRFVESSQATPDREFEQWVHERLAQWPTMVIYQLERWLRERDAHEFLPAVHATLRRRGIGPQIAVAAMRSTAR